MRSFARLLVAGAAILALVSPLACSLTREAAQCESTAECREGFGTGYVCQNDGLCELPPANISCTAQYPSNLLSAPQKYRDYIVLGSLLRAEGKEGARHDAAKLAVEAVNNFISDNEDLYPDLMDLRFGLVQCNHDGDVELVADLAEYLTETIQVPAILGPASSSSTAAAFRRVNLDADGNETRKVVFVSPSATSVALTDLEETKPGFLWRTAPTDDGQGRLMGDYAVAENSRFLAFYEETPYGEGLFRELENATGELCDECGFSFEADTDDVVPLTRMLAKDSTRDALAEVDTVFFMGAQETHLAEMMKRLGSPEFADKTLFLSDAAASADTVSSVAGEHIERVVGTRPRAAEDGEATRFFTAAYQGRHDESPLIHSFTAHAYDATWLMLIASVQAKLDGRRITPESIARGLTLLTNDDWGALQKADDSVPARETCPQKLVDDVCTPLTLDETYLPDIIEGLLTVGKIDVQGASGDLDYDPETEELANSADAFEFWHLNIESTDEVSIIGGMGPRE